MAGDIYTAVYSGVPVYEVMCRGIAVMRRKQDSYLNATQILKVAGIEKGKRTKILERDILNGEHEKVQGGYGKYQGTWVPFQRGKDLAKEYKVEPLLRALFEYDVQQGQIDTITPTKEMMIQKQKEGAKAAKVPASPRQSPSSKRARSASAKPSTSQTLNPPSMTPSPLHPSLNVSSPSIPPSPQWHMDQPPRKRVKAASPVHYEQDIPPDNDIQDYGRTGLSRSDHGMDQLMEEPLEGAEKYRSILMAIFLNDESEGIPPLLTDPTIPSDLDIDLVIDDQGHTALHWAAALARIPVLELLVQKHVDVRRVNYNGESALVRAVLVTNNFDKQSFPHLLNILHKAIPIVDRKNRTLLHHIAITAGMRARGSSSHYYMECLLEWIARNGGDFSSLIDIQDTNGDTALTIAARVGDRYLAKFLLDVGANRDVENRVGLKAGDFGIDDVNAELLEQPFMPRTYVPVPTAEDLKESQTGKRGKEVMSAVQKMVDELDGEFSHEILARQGQLQDTQSLLRQATRDLTETRKTIGQCRTQAQQLEEAHQKIKNLELSLEEESLKTQNLKGYLGRTRNNEDIDLLFSVKRPSLLSTQYDTMMYEDQATDDAEREKKAEQDVLQLRSRVYAYQKIDEELSQELAETSSKTCANELLCKKVIAICCNIPLEKVDDMLVPLTLAVESDGASLDLSRVAGFMSRVKQQEAMTLAATAPTATSTTNA
ncbi:transcriptional regulator swi6 [Entomortierella beljakovae]|nr:transcriptional regulator swi6 [Entomortierella beljakovae]